MGDFDCRCKAVPKLGSSAGGLRKGSLRFPSAGRLGKPVELRLGFHAVLQGGQVGRRAGGLHEVRRRHGGLCAPR